MKLQTEDDERTNTRVLTCFLLPQTEQHFDIGRWVHCTRVDRLVGELISSLVGSVVD